MGMYTVPLVVYEDGKRILVGEAIAKDDGTIQAQIDPSVRGVRLLDMLRSHKGEFSIAER